MVSSITFVGALGGVCCICVWNTAKFQGALNALALCLKHYLMAGRSHETAAFLFALCEVGSVRFVLS